MTKECSQYTSQAGSFCTITRFNLKTIDVGAKVVYAQSAGAPDLWHWDGTHSVEPVRCTYSIFLQIVREVPPPRIELGLAV